ncbi:protein of unknown function [Mucilaginibacter mallensis]|uniref:eCIS core domain-containing protein n=1 Tax=Mucilaginibacter mallensis TaxID=652787 RepID=A0A1H1XSM1_MUCMA|nr:DUF4157 domain-containing protein [Mucilaginibacter mallensis]SDT12225.1 protein of unknown function [Mucilaginibacter mallensis]
MDKAKTTRSQQQILSQSSGGSGDKAAKGYPAVTRFAQPHVSSAGGSNALPHQLQQGVEALSGMSMAGTSVHYNSSAPAQIGALAYAAGNQIHLGPGQEQHLPHEAWHVVQQKQGRVKPTLQAKGLAVNDDHALETEADVMGQRAVQPKTAGDMPASPLNNPGLQPGDIVQRKIGFEFQAYDSITIEGVSSVANPLTLPNKDGFKVETDVGKTSNELEIVTEAVEETDAGLIRLTHIMTKIGEFMREVDDEKELKKITPFPWKPEVPEDAIFMVKSGKHFHPQATVGVKFEKVAELIHYITQAPFKEGGKAKETITRRFKKASIGSDETEDDFEIKEEVMPVAEVKMEGNSVKITEADKFGWSGQDDQQTFKYAWKAGLERANANSKLTSDKVKGLAAIFYGLAENQTGKHGIVPKDPSFLKYWMPFTLRNGFRPFFDSLDEKEQGELKSIGEELNVPVMPPDGELKSDPPKIADILKDMLEKAGKSGDTKMDLLQTLNSSYGKGVLGHGVIGGIERPGDENRYNYKSWGMDTIDDIGISQKETEKRRGAIIELRKLGNDVPAEKLEEFALAVFSLVRAINTTDGSGPARTGIAIGATATGSTTEEAKLVSRPSPPVPPRPRPPLPTGDRPPLPPRPSRQQIAEMGPLPQLPLV